MSFVGICDWFRGLETKPRCPRIMKMDLVGTVVWSRHSNAESGGARDQTSGTKNLKIRHLCHMCQVLRSWRAADTPPSPIEHAKSCAPHLNKPENRNRRDAQLLIYKRLMPCSGRSPQRGSFQPQPCRPSRNRQRACPFPGPCSGRRSARSHP